MGLKIRGEKSRKIRHKGKNWELPRSKLTIVIYGPNGPISITIVINYLSPKMTEAMMPIPNDAIYYRTLLFDLAEPVHMPINKFNEVRIYITPYIAKTDNFK